MLIAIVEQVVLKSPSYHISVQMILVAAVDLILAMAAVAVARVIVHGPSLAWTLTFHLSYAASMVLYGVVVWASLASVGLYDSRQRYGIEGILARMLVGAGIAGMIVAMLGFLLAFDEGRRVWLLSFGFTVVLLSLARLLFHRFVDEDMFRRRVLVYGAGKRAESILQLRRRSDQRGFRVIGFLSAESDTKRLNDPRVITDDIGLLIDYVAENDIDEIVVAVDDRRKSFPIEELLTCKLSGIRISDLLEFLERESGRVKVDLMNPSWLIFSESFNRRNRKRLSFKALDLIVASILVVLTWPLMIAVALMVLIDDGRPVLYRQTRVGLNGREFTLYKFRSMKKTAETEGGAVWATTNDPRVTRIGYWLRKLRLDELPQLFNVLRGDMSIVGPRPERPEFVAELVKRIPYYHERHSVKPGITGWAQLCYPYGASEQDALAKLEFDIYFIKNRSLMFYLIILLQTAEVILWQKGSR